MIHSKKGISLLIGIIVSLWSCSGGTSEYMSKGQHQRIKTAYDSLQSTYDRLVSQYETSADSMSPDLKNLYAQMQQMHNRMNMNHQQMMSMNMDQYMQKHHNKMRSIDMVIHMQDKKAEEWYQQMISMHDHIAALHKKQGPQKMAQLNHQLSTELGNITKMNPSYNKPTKVPFNEKGNPAYLNGKSLFTRNCASCHANDAKGIAGVFPPLVNSKWVTGNKTVPIRILLHGLTGQIDVNGQRYQGTMPSFKARLSAAEMTSILNYLRSLSDKKLPEIKQGDVIGVGKNYKNRVRPWNAKVLK